MWEWGEDEATRITRIACSTAIWYKTLLFTMCYGNYCNSLSSSTLDVLIKKRWTSRRMTVGQSVHYCELPWGARHILRATIRNRDFSREKVLMNNNDYVNESCFNNAWFDFVWSHSLSFELPSQGWELTSSVNNRNYNFMVTHTLSVHGIFSLSSTSQALLDAKVVREGMLFGSWVWRLAFF